MLVEATWDYLCIHSERLTTYTTNILGSTWRASRESVKEFKRHSEENTFAFKELLIISSAGFSVSLKTNANSSEASWGVLIEGKTLRQTTLLT